jgi:hypothetical protein
MIEQYISNPEYQTYYQKLDGLRFGIANDLPIESDMRILDVAIFAYGWCCYRSGNEWRMEFALIPGLQTRDGTSA